MAPECPGWFFWGAQSIDLYYYNGRVVQIGQKTSFFWLKGTWAKIDRKKGKLHSLNRIWTLMKFFFFAYHTLCGFNWLLRCPFPSNLDFQLEYMSLCCQRQVQNQIITGFFIIFHQISSKCHYKSNILGF